MIVGAGIAGLATAYFLEQCADETGVALDCVLVEREPRTGGKVTTERVNGFVIEGGPDSLFAAKPAAIELCRELGLGDQIVPPRMERRRTFVVRRGRLVPLPDGIELVLPTRFLPFVTSPLFSPVGKLRMAMEPLIPSRRDGGDESVADFVTRRLGREALDRLAAPLLSGIYAAEPTRQSVLATFPSLRQTEGEHGSLLVGALTRRRLGRRDVAANGGAHSSCDESIDAARGAAVSRTALRRSTSPFFTLQGGLADLTAALVGRLRVTRFIQGVEVAGVQELVGGAGAPDPQAGDRCRSAAVGAHRVTLADGTALAADAVVLAVPARASARLLAGVAPSLACRLGELRTVSTATVSLGFDARDVAHPMDGFGFVVPPSEGRDIFACTWTSTKFDHRAPPGFRLVRAFVGGAGGEALARHEDRDLIEIVRRELASLMGIRAEPIVARAFRWSDGQPQYDVGHLDRVRDIDEVAAKTPGLFLVGSALHGVGVPDCISDARRCASAVYDFLTAQAMVRGV